MKRILIAVLVMGWASPVWAAGFNSGNDLFAECQVEKTDDIYYQSNANCMGYIMGAFDASNGADEGIGSITFCAPELVSVKQVTDIVVKCLIDHPQHRHHVAASLVAAALNEVWPCP